jgi:hypothetical protein
MRRGWPQWLRLQPTFEIVQTASVLCSAIGEEPASPAPDEALNA